MTIYLTRTNTKNAPGGVGVVGWRLAPLRRDASHMYRSARPGIERVAVPFASRCCFPHTKATHYLSENRRFCTPIYQRRPNSAWGPLRVGARLRVTVRQGFRRDLARFRTRNFAAAKIFGNFWSEIFRKSLANPCGAACRHSEGRR